MLLFNLSSTECIGLFPWKECYIGLPPGEEGFGLPLKEECIGTIYLLGKSVFGLFTSLGRVYWDYLPPWEECIGTIYLLGKSVLGLFTSLGRVYWDYLPPWEKCIGTILPPWEECIGTELSPMRCQQAAAVRLNLSENVINYTKG